MARPELSLVIPIYNEEEVLPQLDVRLKELLRTLAIDAEVVFVNDGSKDKSLDILRRMASRELRYRVIGFSRNFGHQRAITAGMEKSRGRAVVVMDADLQDPPEVILEMVDKWREGYDVVYGRRRSREGESAFKLVTAKLFYRVFAALIPIEVPLDTGDFRLMSRRVVTTMRGLRESHRFVRGLVAWVGFKQTAVEYDRAARAAGETKYPLKKMIAFAIDGIASFSIQPLRFATYTGVIVGAASVLYAIASMITWFAGMNVPGWTTTVVLVSFLFSVQFFMIGVLGEYVGRIYEQVKRRPLYIVSERINFGRRKVEKLVTSDLEELPAPQLSEEAPAIEPGGSSSVPPPPPAIVAAGAAAEASLSRTPPPPKVGRSPAASPGAGAPSRAAAKPSTTSPTPPKVTPTPPPPKVTPSVPSIKAASIPPPKATPSVPTTKAASIPPPSATPSGSATATGAAAPSATPSAPTTKAASIPPPRASSTNTKAAGASPATGAAATSTTPSAPTTKAASVPPPSATPSAPTTKAASIPPPSASSTNTKAAGASPATGAAAPSTTPSAPTTKAASIPPPNATPSAPTTKAASIPPPSASSTNTKAASVPPPSASATKAAGASPATGAAAPSVPPAKSASVPPRPASGAGASAKAAGSSAAGAATGEPDASAEPPARRDARSLFGAPKDDASTDAPASREPTGEDDGAKGRAD